MFKSFIKVDVGRCFFIRIPHDQTLNGFLKRKCRKCFFNSFNVISSYTKKEWHPHILVSIVTKFGGCIFY